MKLLVVSPDFPYPSTHGGKVDIMRQLEVLADLDLKVDLIICGKDQFNAENDKYVKQFVNKITYAERSNSIADNMSVVPYQAQSRKKLKNVVFEDVYDWIFVESEYVLEVLENPTLRYNKSLLRINNIEYKYFYNLCLSAFPSPKSIYYLLDAAKFFFYSKKAFTKCDVLAFVSNEELAWYNNKYPLAKNGFLFIQHFDVKKFLPFRSKESNNVLFVGSLFMPNNIAGLSWYLKNVHPLLINIPGYNLKIVGSTGKDSSLPAKLKKQFGNFEKIEIFTDVPDLEPFYNDASVFVNPMLNGAGIKVKTLQAIQYGLPVVTTTVGAEGIGLINNEHVFISNNPEIFANNIKRSLTDNENSAEMVSCAQNFLVEIDGARVLPQILSQ